MAMNGFDPVLSEESASSFIETCRKYVQFVKNGENYDKIYDQVLRPLENFKENMARRVEVMARNYIGILHLGKNENEEAIDEFETALSMAREENFKDLVPLVEMNIGYALSKMSPHASQERLNTALKEAIEEGLWKTFQIINLAMAQNFIEMGNFSKARENLDLVESLEVDFKSEVELLRSRITVEDLTLNISSSKTNDEMMI
jgi:tetratricopeptide (TPR) repeat protein